MPTTIQTYRQPPKDYNPVITTRAPREKVILPPMPRSGERSFEMEVYTRFMHNLREVPNSRIEIKVLSAIQFTADVMDHNDALIAKTLVDMGLRAPRQAFPITFLDFADKALARRSWDEGSVPPTSITALKMHWTRIGEDPFAEFVRTEHSLYSQMVM